MSGLSRWFDRLPTPGKLLIILAAAVLPLGLVLAWAAASGINRASDAVVENANGRSRSATRSIESLIARNAMALRIAASAALRENSVDPCAVASRALALSPAVAQRFSLRRPDGQMICMSGRYSPDRDELLVQPGQLRVWISPGGSALYYRVGVVGGIATGSITSEQLREAATAAAARDLDQLTLSDGNMDLRLIAGRQTRSRLPFQTVEREAYLAANQLTARTVSTIDRLPGIDRLIILLPLLMWLLAAVLSWFAVDRFLIRPLRRMQRAVSAYQPGSGALILPERLGSATEIRELGQSFARSVERIEESEKEMAIALEGQRKLVREVHHRVKNNLQVVASLLNIHGRSAGSQDARDAYSSIGRRVDALAVVHRNHYAELEENRGIALRPLLSELAASLRASAPESARRLNIDLELEGLHTTQDVAVAVAFLVTEVVEFAMLVRPDDPVELSLRRSGDLTARFVLSSPVLNPEAAEDEERKLFERIISGLAKQLRSSLDRTLGRYSVELPVFPAR